MNSLCVTVNYAADRILDRISWEERNPTDKHQSLFNNTSDAVRRLERATFEIQNPTKEGHRNQAYNDREIADLYSTMWGALLEVYKVSCICLPHALTRTGMNESAEWRMAFQDHQAVISSAARYIDNVYLHDDGWNGRPR
jgi:hypothetical protein